ncbi:hypothetical protein SLEP1_g53070 [Rubroshorea leprosula]|uniref:Integrase catalytic domain-containing protein n=1 Tax=Rubroshorea leprosula TaxID=152421 RepID=A0AAV5MBQ8_9ROSI|nr:hypothetical protein SLEP1_g53070 [Rubroshorea leprosula]
MSHTMPPSIAQHQQVERIRENNPQHLAELLARDNPGDPLITLLNPTNHAPNHQLQQNVNSPTRTIVPPQNESQGHSHMAPPPPNPLQPIVSDVSKSLQLNSINSYAELATSFATKFSSQRLIRKTTSELMRVIQREGESLKNYMNRFNDTVLEIDLFNQAVGLAAIIQGLKHERFRDSLTEEYALSGKLALSKEVRPLTWRDEGQNKKRFKTAHNQVTSVIVNNCEVQRVLIDIGNTLDIMYYHCFESIGLDPAFLQKHDGLIYGFNNQPVPVEGVLKLNVAFGTVVVSQSHLRMKFPTLMEVVTLKGNQEVARHCYMTSVTRPQKNKQATPPESAQPEVPTTQKVMGVELLDNILEDEARATPAKEVEETSANMLGIPTSVTVHKLSTYLLKKPITQKRCLFGGERLEAIRAEMQKLLQDCHRLPSIDKLVEVAFRNERLSLLDAYSGYHQVDMALENEVKTSFYASDDIYYYVMMPFGLKNVKAAYHKLVTIVFQAQIGRNLEVYVDDIVVKSLKVEDHLTDRAKTFDNLRKHSMRLNPAKCVFGVEFGKFLGFMVSRRGIKFNLEKIKAIEEIKPPKSVKDVQRLAGGSPPLLTKAEEGEILYLYLRISDVAIGLVLVRKVGKQQRPVYYTSKVLQGAELRYSIAKKATLAIVTIARKLRPYFQTHPIVTLYLDGSSSNKGSGVGAVLMGPGNFQSEHALKLNFEATNNIDEYKAFLLGLHLAAELKVRSLQPSMLFARYMKVYVGITLKLGPWPIRYFSRDKAEYALRKVHEGVCGNHIGARTLAHKILCSIIYRYGIPYQVVADNGPQFNCTFFKDFCSNYGIKLVFTSVYHPKANRMVEFVNKAILEGIKLSLDQVKAKWADELNNVLWYYRIMS